MGRSWESQAVTAIGIGRPSPFCMNPEAMANTNALGELPEMASEGPRTCLGDLELSLVQGKDEGRSPAGPQRSSHSSASRALSCSGFRLLSHSGWVGGRGDR